MQEKCATCQPPIPPTGHRIIYSHTPWTPFLCLTGTNTKTRLELELLICDRFFRSIFLPRRYSLNKTHSESELPQDFYHIYPAVRDMISTSYFIVMLTRSLPPECAETAHYQLNICFNSPGTADHTNMNGRRAQMGSRMECAPRCSE